ncbi:MAG: DUF4147 domain-containing protein [Gammaproteobacteria bacterium]|nr:DUF4147 domain-containing protein [Gammaproteobacteria bacterium]
MQGNPKEDLLNIYRAAIARVSGFSTVKAYLTHNPLIGRHHLVAIGKAASAMTRGALAAMDDKITHGLVITKHGHLQADLHSFSGFTCLQADHPIPGEDSLVAGSVLIHFLLESSPSTRFLFLISGGASSLVEVLPEGMNLDKLQSLNDELLASGLNIADMNKIRKAASRIKGGQLLSYLAGREAKALMISDVPKNDPAIIGSGLLAPESDEPCLAQFPEPMRKLLGGVDLSPTTQRDFSLRVSTSIIATLEDAKQAAADKALALGYPVKIHAEFLDGDAVETAAKLASQLHRAPAGIHIWGGEATVTLPVKPGRGGRNQHLSLALAISLQKRPDIATLAAATDGTDGPTEDAGGLIDGGTLERGQAAGLQAEECLAAADAGRFLEASGDLLTTGPTGTNVMDLVIALKRNSNQ